MGDEPDRRHLVRIPVPVRCWYVRRPHTTVVSARRRGRPHTWPVCRLGWCRDVQPGCFPRCRAKQWRQASSRASCCTVRSPATHNQDATELRYVSKTRVCLIHLRGLLAVLSGSDAAIVLCSSIVKVRRGAIIGTSFEACSVDLGGAAGLTSCADADGDAHSSSETNQSRFPHRLSRKDR